MYDPISPVHPTYELARYQLWDPARQVVEMTPLYPPPAGPDSDDPNTDIDASKSIDELLLASRRGLESVAGDITHLLDERRRDGADIIAGIDRDQLYLDNLILDRYRHGERATDDQTYVRLREQQLKLESERRREQSSQWRDTVLLAKELSELRRRIDEARQRELMLGGDAP